MDILDEIIGKLSNLGYTNYFFELLVFVELGGCIFLFVFLDGFRFFGYFSLLDRTFKESFCVRVYLIGVQRNFLLMQKTLREINFSYFHPPPKTGKPKDS